MTERQAELLRFIASYQAEHRYAPSYQEMTVALGFASKGRVAPLLRGLRAAGLVEWKPRFVRSVMLTEKGERLLGPKALGFAFELAELPNDALFKLDWLIGEELDRRSTLLRWSAPL